MHPMQLAHAQLVLIAAGFDRFGALPPSFDIHGEAWRAIEKTFRSEYRDERRHAELIDLGGEGG